MDTSTLKVYLVEDDWNRIKQIKIFFDRVNRKLEKHDKSMQNELTLFLKEQGYKRLLVEEIKTEQITNSKESNYYNFLYSENVDFIQQLEDICKKDENRFFLLDLALNQEEREEFRKIQERLMPGTARKVIKMLEERNKEELIILNTRCKNLRDIGQKLLKIKNKSKLHLEIMDAWYFSTLAPSKQAEEILLEKIEDFLGGKL